MYVKPLLLVLLLCLFTIQVLTEQCTSPNGKTGKCLPLKSCTVLLEAFQNPKKGTENQLRKFLCLEENKEKKKEETNDIMVCCGVSSNLTQLEIEQIVPEANINKVALNNVEECGKIHSVFCSAAGEDINVPVLPWLVKVLAADAEGNAYPICSGSLINERYIVTGAQCVDTNALVDGKRFVVRFGSKYVESRNVEEECSDVQYFEVQEVVKHPFYRSQNQLHDIALLRLNKTVLDRALYRPVCLPLPQTTQAKPENKFSIPRWDNPLPENQTAKQCKFTYENKNITGSVTIHDVIPIQFGNGISITQTDDAGTPVMFSHSEKWYLEGIVSQSKNCDNDQPGVYTKVGDYLTWIQENMRQWPAEECKTPEGGSGKCIDLSDCPSLLSSSVNPTKTLEQHLHKYICEEGQFYGTFRVCCDSALSVSVSSSRSSNQANKNATIVELTDLKHCGFQNLESKSMAGDEFPWLARVVPPEGNNTLCLGSLINSRYILTEAWCSYDLGKNALVRLGETTNEKGQAFMEVGIEAVTVHPFFVYWARLNNIALLRLKETVAYTSHIQPICLPTTDTPFAKHGDTLYTSGWDYASPEKGITQKRISTTLIAHEKCNLPFVRPVEKYSMCTMALRNNTELSCFGDSGGPLMYANNNQWYIQGVVSTLDCNNQGQQVHTRVSEYLKWIEENMKPWK